jgi:hypothetical protein
MGRHMRFLFLGIALIFPLQSLAEWTPPSDPDYEAILSEARADAHTGHSEDALAKQLWFSNSTVYCS